MAEQGGSGSSKGFAKSFSKKVFRTKEKVLQNLGKSDKTTDEEFDKFVADFQRQQHVANKLQKELKNYIAQVKNMAHATKALYETMRDTYEPEWTGYGNLIETVEAVNTLWEAYLSDLQDRVQNPMNTYIQRFPEVRSKISKRGRKLVDFDSARHNLDTQVAAKKRDETKISKAREELTEARHIYKSINEDLHRELPVLYEGRVTIITSNFSSMFSAEAKFEEESAKLKNGLAEITEKLATESSESFFAATAARPLMDNRGSMNMEMNSGEVSPGLSKLYNIPTPNEVANDRNSTKSSPRTPKSAHSRKSSSGSSPAVPSKAFHDTDDDEDDILAVPRSRVSNGDMYRDEKPPGADGKRAEGDGKTAQDDGKKMEEAMALHEPMYETVDIGAQLQDANIAESSTDKPEPKKEADKEAAEEEDEKEKDAEGTSVYAVAGDTEDIYKVPPSNEPLPKPDGVIYQVQATHAYGGEDYDELTFEAGDMINVVPFEDPDEQDEGWLMGFRVGGTHKGVFPANFTKRI